MGTLKYKTYFIGAYYHIYNRGNAKQNIFLENEDYIEYLKKLREAKEKNQITILFYCLMPNHIHLVVRQDTDKPIYRFISSLHTSYSMYFNKKYRRVGHLFQDRFKQKIIDKDEYLLYLSCYVHLNPMLDQLVEKIGDYQWSSYVDYIGLRKGTLCDKNILQDLSAEQGQSFCQAYKNFVENNKNVVLQHKIIKEHLKDCP